MKNIGIKYFSSDRQSLKERCLKDRLLQRQPSLSREQFQAAIKVAVTDAAADAVMLCRAKLQGVARNYFSPGQDSALGVAILDAIEYIETQSVIESCLTLQTLSKEEI